MPTDAELDVLVEQAIKTIRDRGDKVKFKTVLEFVKHKHERVLKSYQRHRELDRTKRLVELQRTISPDIAEALLKDREEFTKAKTELLNDEIVQLVDDCDTMQDEITELRKQLAEVAELADRDRSTLNVTIATIQEDKHRHAGVIDTLRDEINTLKTDRDKAINAREGADKKRERMQCTLAAKAESERRERERADRLQRRLEDEMRKVKDLEDQLAEKNAAKPAAKSSR